MKYIELTQSGNIEKENVADNKKYVIDKDKLYIRKISDENYLVINTFKNKCFILNKEAVKQLECLKGDLGKN